MLITLKLSDFLAQMDDPRRGVIQKIYQDHKTLFHTAKGSAVKHHAWVGGYADHLLETFRIARLLYRTMNAEFGEILLDDGATFTEESVLIALFFHDVEKLFKYGDAGDLRCAYYQGLAKTVSWHELKWQMISDLEKAYGFQLTALERHGVRYAHAESDREYNPHTCVMNAFAAIVHGADILSARARPHGGRGLA